MTAALTAVLHSSLCPGCGPPLGMPAPAPPHPHPVCPPFRPLQPSGACVVHVLVLVPTTPPPGPQDLSGFVHEHRPSKRKLDMTLSPELRLPGFACDVRMGALSPALVGSTDTWWLCSQGRRRWAGCGWLGVEPGRRLQHLLPIPARSAGLPSYTHRSAREAGCSWHGQ